MATTTYHLEVNFSTAIPAPVGVVGSPGNIAAATKAYSLEGHVHAGASSTPLPVPPDTYGGKLWTGWIQDALQLAAVDAMYIGDVNGLFTAAWDEVQTGTWRKAAPGMLASILTDNVWPWTGMRLLAAANGLSTADQIAQGIYVLTDTGAPITGPVVYQLQDDDSLTTATPSDSGVYSGDPFNDVGCSYVVFETPAGVPNLTSWPASSSVPVVFYARIFNPSGNVYQLFLNSTSEGGGNTAYALARDTGSGIFNYQNADVPLQPLTGAWQRFALNIPVGALTTSASDRLVLTIRAMGPNNDPGVLQVAFGGNMPCTIAPPWTITTLHYATMQRAPDADATADFSNGMYVLVEGGLVRHGETWQATLPSPFELDVNAQAWASVTAPTPADSDVLLTAAELSLASPTVQTATVSVTASGGEQTLLTCTEYDDALGGTTIPGTSPWRAHCQISNFVAGDGPTVITVYVRGNGQSGARPWLLLATTQPLQTTDYGNFLAVGTLGIDYALAAGEKLQAKFTATTTSTTPVAVALIFNDSPHSTYLEVPAVFGNAGTDDHTQLINRNVLNPDGSGQHQRRFVDDVALPPVSLDGSGNLTPDPTANIVLFSTEVTVNRIDTSQWPNGKVGRLTLFFLQKGHVGNLVGISGSFAQVQMGDFGGLSGAQGEQADFGYDGLINLVLIGGDWNLDGAPNMGRTTL